MVLKEIEAGLNLWDRFKSTFRKDDNKPSDTVAFRFMRLFEEHSVHRNQIPRFFGHDLEVADFVSEDALMNKLSESIMQEACDLFGIRREWLDCADDLIYQTHDFYQTPDEFVKFLEDLKNSNNIDPELSGIVLTPQSPERSLDSVLIIREGIGEVGGREIYRNYICGNWVSNYWKCRAYLTACISIMGKYNYYVRGRYVKSDSLTLLSDGQSFFDIENSKFTGRGWQPEDMIYRPDMYLAGVDPELNNYGRVSAIKKWLELASKGYMDSYLPAQIKVFQEELEKQLANKR
jgi:hypothetical protein